MVDFEKRDGSREAYLVGILGLASFTPGARQSVALHFGSAEVRLTGTNLLPLYEAILRQRVSKVTERDPMTRAAIEAVPFVEDVNIVRGDSVKRTKP